MLIAARHPVLARRHATSGTFMNQTATCNGASRLNCTSLRCPSPRGQQAVTRCSIRQPRNRGAQQAGRERHTQVGGCLPSPLPISNGCVVKHVHERHCQCQLRGQQLKKATTYAVEVRR
ncbi:hypothetical protein LX36DRAFT_388159 [Colletotrichum falcatum]|nr:hypothetical protein LX36DRAFT_388159 [Colletotrichum falcatum]